VLADPGAWTKDGAWRIHGNGPIGWVNSSQGSFLLTLKRPKKGVLGLGGSHVVFVVDYKDQSNYIEFQLDGGGSLERRIFVNGAPQQKHTTKLGSHEEYSLRVDILPERISVTSGSQTDSFPRPSRDQLGKFGVKGEAAVQIAQEK
jgi:hypothetical protein